MRFLGVGDSHPSQCAGPQECQWLPLRGAGLLKVQHGDGYIFPQMVLYSMFTLYYSTTMTFLPNRNLHWPQLFPLTLSFSQTNSATVGLIMSNVRYLNAFSELTATKKTLKERGQYKIV